MVYTAIKRGSRLHIYSIDYDSGYATDQKIRFPLSEQDYVKAWLKRLNTAEHTKNYMVADFLVSNNGRHNLGSVPHSDPHLDGWWYGKVIT